MHTHPLSLTRRQFLQAAAIGLAAPALAVADDKKLFGGFTLGVQSYTFRKFPLEQCLKRTHDLGLHYIEFYNGHVSPKSTPEQVKAVVKLCGDYGITPVAFGVEAFTKDHDRNRRLFDFGKQLGVKSLSADPTPDSFESLDKLVDEYKIAIAIHPHGPQHRWKSAEIILAAVKDHHPLVGTCLDTGHLLKVVQLGKPLNCAQQVRVMGARNFGLHLKDHDVKKGHDVIYGEGPLDVPAVLKALRDVDFKGSISIEYEHHENEPSADVKQCVALFQEAVKKV